MEFYRILEARFFLLGGHNEQEESRICGEFSGGPQKRELEFLGEKKLEDDHGCTQHLTLIFFFFFWELKDPLRKDGIIIFLGDDFYFSERQEFTPASVHFLVSICITPDSALQAVSEHHGIKGITWIH